MLKLKAMSTQTPDKADQGIIIIPDISGFSNFVISSDLVQGEHVVKQLLGTLLLSNDLSLQVSEIEGDAVLFYKHGINPTLEEVIVLAERMYASFCRKRTELSQQLSFPIDLSLKFVVHYGSFSTYKLGSFEKLYGKPIVEAHKLLKNHLSSTPAYILFTTAFLLAASEARSVNLPGNRADDCEQCRYFDNVGYIHYLAANSDVPGKRADSSTDATPSQNPVSVAQKDLQPVIG